MRRIGTIMGAAGVTLVGAMILAAGCNQSKPTGAAPSAKTPSSVAVREPVTTNGPSDPEPAKQLHPQAATQMTRPNVGDDLTPRELYVAYCSGCHSLNLIESQRLDRGTWEWVMDDVINKYGATWITKEERAVLVDFLVANFGREAN